MKVVKSYLVFIIGFVVFVFRIIFVFYNNIIRKNIIIFILQRKELLENLCNMFKFYN